MHFTSPLVATILLATATPIMAVGGGVKNNSRYTMRTADLSQSKRENTDRCHVYNWNDGDGSVGWSEARIKCKQTSLTRGQSRGGLFSLSDVDGITFPYNRWRIIWESGRSYDFAEGVWAKIADGEEASCGMNADGVVPECRVRCRVDTERPNSCIGQ